MKAHKYCNYIGIWELRPTQGSKKYLVYRKKRKEITASIAWWVKYEKRENVKEKGKRREKIKVKSIK
jgi:hypothetical protein